MDTRWRIILHKTAPTAQTSPPWPVELMVYSISHFEKRDKDGIMLSIRLKLCTPAPWDKPSFLPPKRSGANKASEPFSKTGHFACIYTGHVFMSHETGCRAFSINTSQYGIPKWKVTHRPPGLLSRMFELFFFHSRLYAVTPITTFVKARVFSTCQDVVRITIYFILCLTDSSSGIEDMPFLDGIRTYHQ